jgi:membrane peptidoglycan carboxypeptidase
MVEKLDETPSPDKLPARKRSRARLIFWIVLAIIAAAGVDAVLYEVRHSRLQAHYFAEFAQSVRWELQPGPNPDLWLPRTGTYDERLGYTRLQEMLARLTKAGFEVTEQARQSDGFRKVTGHGYYPIYREKSQAGLTLVDRNEAPLHVRRFPERQYDSFEAIPPLLVAALLFVENNDLLDPDHPRRNPAVDWVRLSRVAVDQTLRAIDLEGGRAGGSTLATQIEKFRHSPGGRTRDAEDKLTQMVSASLRAYLDGEETLAARQRIVLGYLNSVPLAGMAGYGEINGLGDGLWAWYGRDFAFANRVLADPGADPAERAQVFKEVLSLIVAQRRPSGLLLGSTPRLDELTNSYVRLLAAGGHLPDALRDAALRVKLAPARRAPEGDAISFVERKAVNDARGALGDLLGIGDPYALDRFDLAVRATLDAPVQAGVTTFLSRLSDPAYLACAGFKERRLLDRGDPTGVHYSFTLYEKTELGNVLRVQADNLNQPLDINAGTKLDLGSSAKLRTLVSYLNVVADLHRRYGEMDAEALAAVATRLRPSDRLSHWAIDYLRTHDDRTLTPLLEAAMERRYPANTDEAFFTGGGMHRFSNFRRDEDALRPSVAEALEQSINLVFVRLMRDVVHYHAYEADDAPARALHEEDETAEAARQDFLNRFAEREGIGFLRTFWHKYRDVPADERLAVLAESAPNRPSAQAAVYLGVNPQSTFEAFQAHMRERRGERADSESRLRRLYDNHATRNYNLSDQGYLAQVHPLELWLVRHLSENPNASLRDIVAASVAERREASRWLFASRFRRAQQVRINIIVEVTAFERITEEWRRLGYPFESLVPSLATSIGSSADRPAALAELMGIIVNDGVRRPTVRIDRLHFAAATPYETRLERRVDSGERVLPPEVAQVTRSALRRVVASGTARRVEGVYLDADDVPLAVGGKTGTGDHRFQIVGADGEVKSSRVMNRAATFAFYLGDRFYGVVTAFVPGAKAAAYDFTSSLPVQILKELQPVLNPLIAGKEATPGRCVEVTPEPVREPAPALEQIPVRHTQGKSE